MIGLLARLLGKNAAGEEPRRIVEVGWLIDAEKSGFIYEAPRPYQRRAPAPQSAKAVGHCPAVIDYEARHVEIPCPYDLHLRLGKDEGGQYRTEFVSSQRSAASSTTWVKGQSGNPSGRRKEVGPVRELAKQYTQAAIETLAAVMEDAKAPHSARVAAAEALLARAWGKPQQSIDMSIESPSPSDLKPDIAALWERARSETSPQGEPETPAEVTFPQTH